MDIVTLLEVLVRQGGLAVVALVMFYHYKKDVIDERDEAKLTVARLLTVIEDNTSAMKALEAHIQRVSVCPMQEYRRFMGRPPLEVPAQADGLA